MTLRKSASVLAALLLSASFAAAASAQTTHHRAMRHSHAMAHREMPTSAGNAATDALNEQSLNSARSGTAPSISPTSPSSSSAPASTPAQ